MTEVRTAILVIIHITVVIHMTTTQHILVTHLGLVMIVVAVAVFQIHHQIVVDQINKSLNETTGSNVTIISGVKRGHPHP